MSTPPPGEPVPPPGGYLDPGRRQYGPGGYGPPSPPHQFGPGPYGPPPSQPPFPSPGAPPTYPYPSYAYRPVRRTNGMAVAAMACGIAGVTVTCGLTSILGVIFGHIALGQLERNPDEDGRGYAIAGLATGYAVLGIIVIVLLVLALVAIGSG